MKLSGKVALITGASRGIGRAVAVRFAQEGASLFLTYRTDEKSMRQTEKACKEAGANVASSPGDLSLPGVPDLVFAAATAQFGPVDIVVNNAAVSREDLLAVIDDHAIWDMIGTNVTGVVCMTRAAVQGMLRRRKGVVINLSSATASHPGRGGAVYAGTKGFVESFTRAVAAEVGRKGIRVNAIAPGVIETQMNAALRAVAGDELKKRIAQQRFGSPEEVASVAAWLASDDASYVNGAVVAVDGGFGLGV